MPINKGLGGFCFLKSVKDEFLFLSDIIITKKGAIVNEFSLILFLKDDYTR